MHKYLQKMWPKIRNKAAHIANNPQRRKALYDFTYKKLPYLLINTEVARSIIEDCKTLIRMVQAFFRRNYTGISYNTVMMIITALLYFVMPLDLFPDWVPAGLIDDAAVLSWLVNALKRDISDFRYWEENQDRSDNGEISTPSA